jgi:hypothetical protein
MWRLPPSGEEECCINNGDSALGEVLSDLSEQTDSRIEDRHLMSITRSSITRSMTIAISQKYAVSQTTGFNREKNAIHLLQMHGERKRNFVRQNFQACGYSTSTVQPNDKVIQAYRRNQEQEDLRLDRISLWS